MLVGEKCNKIVTSRIKTGTKTDYPVIRGKLMSRYGLPAKKEARTSFLEMNAHCGSLWVNGYFIVFFMPSAIPSRCYQGSTKLLGRI